jgi:hypothetical protein
MITYTVEVDEDGSKHWYLDGKLHRKDGPAIEKVDGYKVWYLNDKRHRIDGPAIEYADGTKEWWIDNKRHREDGPAIEWADGTKAWWINGKELTEEEFLRQTKKSTSSCNNKVVEIDGKKYRLMEV